MLRKKDIYTIFRQIVINYPYDRCTQLNTFALTDTSDFFVSENLQATYNNFIAGEFWNRKWVLAGANPNELCKDYPVLALEQKRAITTKRPKNLLLEVWVVIADIPDCPSCDKACNRSIFEVDSDLQQMAFNVLHELNLFSYYKVTKDGEDNYYWLTVGQADLWKTEGLIDSYKEKGYLSSYFDNDPVDIEATEIGSPDGARAVSFKIDFTVCLDSAVFEYEHNFPDNTGVTKCKNC